MAPSINRRLIDAARIEITEFGLFRSRASTRRSLFQDAPEAFPHGITKNWDYAPTGVTGGYLVTLDPPAIHELEEIITWLASKIEVSSIYPGRGTFLSGQNG
jgi:hypothetical protein